MVLAFGSSRSPGFIQAHTLRHNNAVAFGVERRSDLHKVAVALYAILESGRLHEKGIAAGLYAPDTLIVASHHVALAIAVDELAHALVSVDGRVLEEAARRAALDAAVANRGLRREIIGALDIVQ